MAEINVQAIIEAAKKRFKTKQIKLSDDVSVTVRELSPAADRALKEKLWQRDADGKFIVLNSKGEPGRDPDGKGRLQLIEGVNFLREWLLAAMDPVEAVDGILSDEVPDSVRDEIYEEIRAINGYDSPATIAKNS